MRNISMVFEKLIELKNDPKPVLCGGEPESFEKCEAECQRYYHCDTIALADDRLKAIEQIISVLNGEVPASENPVLSAILDFLYSSHNGDIFDGIEDLIFKVQGIEECTYAANEA